MTDELKALFTAAPEEPLPIDIERLRQRSASFRRQIRSRNYREIFVGGVLVVVFSLQGVWAGTWWGALGPIFAVLGVVFITYTLMTAGDSPSPEPAADTASYLAQHAEELTYQASMLESVPRWYVAPLLPGMGLILVERTLARWSAGGSLWVSAVVVMVVIGVVAAVIAVNRRVAAALRAKAAELAMEFSDLEATVSGGDGRRKAVASPGTGGGTPSALGCAE